MSTERPILFSAEMVKALLSGSKTQTRRIVKPQPKHDWLGYMAVKGGAIQCGPDYPDGDDDFVKCPYGVPGDRLWVRETWQTVNSEAGPGIAYRADSHFIQPEFDGPDYGAGPSYDYEKYPGDYCMWYTDLVGGAPSSEGYHWKSSIHMPRWASRLTLEITNVRVERLQDITWRDCLHEGVFTRERTSIVSVFGKLWDKINGDGSWDDNPWVWALEFKKVDDEALAEAWSSRGKA